MNYNILFDNQKKYIDYPIYLLIFFSLISFWKLGVVFYSIICFPFEKQLPMTTFVFIFGLGIITSILCMICFPHLAVKMQRLVIGASLLTMLALFFPFTNAAATSILYIHAFLCFFMLGFEIFNVVNFFSEKSAIIYLTLAYGIAYFMIAVLHNHTVRVSFLQFQVVAVACLILILIFLFHLPSDSTACPVYVRKCDNFQLPKKLIFGTCTLAFVGPFMALAGPNMAGVIHDGTFIVYCADAFACFLIYFLYKKMNIHPFYSISAAIGFGCIGLLLMYTTVYVPALGYLGCILIGFGMIPCQLFPLCIVALMRIHPSRYYVPMTTGLFFTAFLIQHLVAVKVIHIPHMYYFIHTICMVFLAFFYLQIGPFFLYTLARQKHEAIRLYTAADTAVDNTVSTSVDTEADTTENTTTDATASELAAIEEPASSTSQPNISELLSKRELQVVDLIGCGFTNADIAKTLVISIHTVNDHTKNIYRKLDVHSRYELIALLNQNKNGVA